MICQKCHTNVDNDLIFCTNCGVRLGETFANQQNQTNEATVVLPNQTKKKSNLKLILLIIGIITVPFILGLGFLVYFNLSANKTVTQKPTPKPLPTKTIKPKNQNKAVDIGVNTANSEVNTNTTNENSETNAEDKNLPKSESVIVDDNVNVDENSHVAFPFKVTEDSVKIIGTVKILDGEQYQGYVFLQDLYDEHSVDPLYKMFSFGSDEEKTDNIEQYLIKGDYVLVFANTDGKGVSVKAEFTQTPQ